MGNPAQNHKILPKTAIFGADNLAGWGDSLYPHKAASELSTQHKLSLWLLWVLCNSTVDIYY